MEINDPDRIKIDQSLKDIDTAIGAIRSVLYPHPAHVDDFPLIWPCDKRPAYLVSKFKDQRLMPFRFDHEGIDISCPVGSKVLAAYDGEVEYAGLSSTPYYGLRIRIKHTIDGKHVTTWYCHLSKLLIKAGQTVKRGDLIALSGGNPTDQPNAGNSTGPHLHFGVQVAGDKTQLTGWSNALIGSVDPLLWVYIP